MRTKTGIPFIIITLLLVSRFCNAQIAPDTYWVEFTDKNNSPYSINNPGEFLSERAILRRTTHQIAITESDLPVNQVYLDSLKNLGVLIHNVSKWFNGAAIYTQDLLLLDTLHHLSFIKHPITLNKSLHLKSSSNKFIDPADSPTETNPSDNQLEMIGIPPLHENGIKGQGMLIGVLDAGFDNVKELESLAHLWQRNKVIATRDFVKDTFDMLHHHTHGTRVLSIIAGNWPGQLTGSAPEADYILLRTENGNSEYLVEEYNWLSGIEYADSLGVDIINSSLGYSTFDDPNQNHTYEDMDGRTTPISRAAMMAAQKGILVVTSAGNSGNSPWYYITAPGDADSILTVGAVDQSEKITGFSSRGPTFDQRIKPDVSAQGSGTVNQFIPGQVSGGAGTSFSAPLIAGLSACVWSSKPESTNQQVIRAIIRSADRYSSPDHAYGYGIPHAVLASSYLSGMIDSTNLTSISAFPNPATSSISLQIWLPWLGQIREGTILLTDLQGRALSTTPQVFYPGYNFFYINEVQMFDAGHYIIHVEIYGRWYRFQFIKLD